MLWASWQPGNYREQLTPLCHGPQWAYSVGQLFSWCKSEWVQKGIEAGSGHRTLADLLPPISSHSLSLTHPWLDPIFAPSFTRMAQNASSANLLALVGTGGSVEVPLGLSATLIGTPPSSMPSLQLLCQQLKHCGDRIQVPLAQDPDTIELSIQIS